MCSYISNMSSIKMKIFPFFAPSLQTSACILYLQCAKIQMSHIARTQAPHMASGYHTGQHSLWSHRSLLKESIVELNTEL